MHIDRAYEPAHIPMPRLPCQLLAGLLAELHQRFAAFPIALLLLGQIEHLIDPFDMLGDLHSPVGPGLAPHACLHRNRRFLLDGLFALSLFQQAVEEKLIGMVLFAARTIEPTLKHGDLLTQLFHLPILYLGLSEQVGDLIVLELQLVYGLCQRHPCTLFPPTAFSDLRARAAARLSET